MMTREEAKEILENWNLCHYTPSREAAEAVISALDPLEIISALRAYAATTDNAELAADIINWVGAEPNEPLTLEQLREMDGEPVWIVDVGPHKWYGPGWAIVDRDNCLVRTVKNWNPVFFERYGEQWLAYRRPKEEQ